LRSSAPVRSATPSCGRVGLGCGTGTRPAPGTVRGSQPADVSELLNEHPVVIVLSRGRQLRLEICEETIALLAERGMRVVHEETGSAIAEYNRLVDAGERVAALSHTTC
jgi:hypothetical protein